MYQEDLARIHHREFGGFADGAAPGVISLLREHGIDEGLVCDLGCGSGILLRELAEAGYRTWGVDVSESMIELARAQAPEAELRVASLSECVIPECAAVTAIGEVLSYLPDGVRRLVGRVAEALPPGGLFLFDVLETGPAMNYRIRRGGPDWSLVVHVSEEKGDPFVHRRITTSRRVDGQDRELTEHHRIRPFERSAIESTLERAGFRCEVCSSWGEEPLADRRVGFVAVRV